MTQTCTWRACMARGAQRPCALQDAMMACGQHEEMAWGKLRDWDGTWLPCVPRKAVGQVSPGRNRVMTSDGSSPTSSRRDHLGSSPQSGYRDRLGSSLHSSYRDRLGSSPHSRQAQDKGTPIKKAHEIRQTTMGHLLVTLTTCLHATMISHTFHCTTVPGWEAPYCEDWKHTSASGGVHKVPWAVVGLAPLI